MSTDNPGNFFRSEDFDNNEEDEVENWKPIKMNGRALYKKAIDILSREQ